MVPAYWLFSGLNSFNLFVISQIDEGKLFYGSDEIYTNVRYMQILDEYIIVDIIVAYEHNNLLVTVISLFSF